MGKFITFLCDKSNHIFFLLKLSYWCISLRKLGRTALGFPHSMLFIQNVSIVIRKVKKQYTMLIYLQATQKTIVPPGTVSSLLLWGEGMGSVAILPYTFVSPCDFSTSVVPGLYRR